MDSTEARARYAEKVRMFFGLDPGTVATSEQDIPLTVTYGQIYQFLVKDADPFSGRPKDSSKGLEAFLYVQNGWVKKVTGRRIQDVYCVHGLVHHSFSLNETPLKPWVLVKWDGRILAAHCNCAIGILEACSHVGATLFSLDILRKEIIDEKKMSVTDLPAYWKNPPKKITSELYKKVKDINFGTRIDKDYQAVIQGEPDDREIEELLNSIQRGGVVVAAMSSFCGDGNVNFSCNPCTEGNELYKRFEAYDLSRLYKSEFNDESLEELQRRALKVYSDLSCDEQSILDIELLTAAQSDCDLWSVLRTGRITASMFKEVLGTSFTRPSISLLKKICHPESCAFTSPAVKYGKQHEEEAINELYHLVHDSHLNLRSIKSGLHLDLQDPCLGASPDAVFLCDCHGKITVEVKCPYSARDCENIVDVLLNLSDPFIFLDDFNNVYFSTKHKYFWQVLMQMHICQAAFGYFYVWSDKEAILFEVKREDEVWTECRSIAVDFFKSIILPELLAKYFTRST